MIFFFLTRTRLLPARAGRLPELSICRRPSGAVATAGPPYAGGRRKKETIIVTALYRATALVFVVLPYLYR
jgi:hypothetical protein